MIELKAVIVGNGYTENNKLYYLCELKRDQETQELEWIYEPANNHYWSNEQEAKDAAAKLGAYFICEKDSTFYCDNNCRSLPFKLSHLGDCNDY